MAGSRCSDRCLDIVAGLIRHHPTLPFSMLSWQNHIGHQQAAPNLPSVTCSCISSAPLNLSLKQHGPAGSNAQTGQARAKHSLHPWVQFHMNTWIRGGEGEDFPKENQGAFTRRQGTAYWTGRSNNAHRQTSETF